MQRTLPSSSSWTLALVLAVLPGCTPPTLPAAAHAQLVQPRDPGERLIYDGAVFDPAGGDPVFRYRRLVRDDGGLRTSTHLTYEPTDAEPLLSLAATHTQDFDFVALAAIDRQRGIVADARMEGDDRIVFESRRGGRHRRRVERVRGPIVVGPTLFGWARAHWDALMRGEVLHVRFAAVDAGRTYGFDLALRSRGADTTVLSFTASSAIVRGAVPAMRLVFATDTREIVRYEGRVPPMRVRGRRLRPFDARVEYAMVAPQFE